MYFPEDSKFQEPRLFDHTSFQSIWESIIYVKQDNLSEHYAKLWNLYTYILFYYT